MRRYFTMGAPRQVDASPTPNIFIVLSERGVRNKLGKRSEPTPFVIPGLLRVLFQRNALSVPSENKDRLHICFSLMCLRVCRIGPA